MFQEYMGLSISRGKCTLCGNKPQALMDFWEVLGIPVTNAPLNYLGLPLVGGALRLIYFNGLFDKIFGRLEGWKIKLLSLEGTSTSLIFGE